MSDAIKVEFALDDASSLSELLNPPDVFELECGGARRTMRFVSIEERQGDGEEIEIAVTAEVAE